MVPVSTTWPGTDTCIKFGAICAPYDGQHRQRYGFRRRTGMVRRKRLRNNFTAALVWDFHRRYAHRDEYGCSPHFRRYGLHWTGVSISVLHGNERGTTAYKRRRHHWRRLLGHYPRVIQFAGFTFGARFDLSTHRAELSGWRSLIRFRRSNHVTVLKPGCLYRAVRPGHVGFDRVAGSDRLRHDEHLEPVISGRGDGEPNTQRHRKLPHRLRGV